MLDLNNIFLFVAVVSPLVVIARTARRAAINRGWQLASLAVLLVTGISWALAPRSAGFVGGGAWLLLLFAPSMGFRAASSLATQHRFAAASRLLNLLVPFHPDRGLRDQAQLLRANALAQRGAMNDALRIFQQIAHRPSPVSRRAAAQIFRLTNDWEGLLAWCERNIARAGVGDDPSLLPLYFRALGELGRREELVLQVAGRAPVLLSSPAYQPVYLTSLALLFAFCGGTETLVRLFTRKRLRLPESAKQFWIATCEAAAGDLASGRARLERLRAETSDELIKADAAQRLARRGQLPPLPLSLTSAASLARLERDVDQDTASVLMPQVARVTPAVLTFIILNVAMFGLELALGGSTNQWTLHRLGALEPFWVFTQGQYWRLLAALFLHYGAVHLIFNLYALFVLGPGLERWIGTARFAVAYLVSGIGSTAGVLLLWRFGLTQADLLVGASGSIMGIVGTWAGVLLGHRHAPLARQRLMNIVFIVVLQSAFDIATPQVSMAAHWGGLISGFVLGLLMTPKHEL